MLPHLIAALALAGADTAAPQLHLLPVPAHVTVSAGRLPVTTTFSVATPKFHDTRLDRAIDRMLYRLEARSGTAYRHVIVRDTAFAPLAIAVDSAGETIQTPAEDESYALSVTANGVQLAAHTVVGALHGMETLLQLVERDSAGVWLPMVEIQDAPRFPWRGLLIDVSRHWEPVPVIERNLDAMAAVKLNVLHWHLSDDQGFRVESSVFPKLQGEGSDGHYYTRDEIRHIVSYARDRGIRVIPEFDMPGHSTSWFVGYPQYASDTGSYQIERSFGVFVPTFDPTREATYRFIDRFVADIAPLFPDPYWHIGGDEVEGSQWKNSAHVQRFMRLHHLKDNGALQAYFNRRLTAILKKHGKQVVGWDEILNPRLPKTVVVQSWRGTQALAQAADSGYDGILSAPYYLDAMRSAEDYYLADPLPDSLPLDSLARSHVLGGEVCMWAELVTPENIESRIWPRTAAVAERFWSPASVRDVPDMYRRLGEMSLELDRLGVQTPDQPRPDAAPAGRQRLDRAAAVSLPLRVAALARSARAGPSCHPAHAARGAGRHRPARSARRPRDRGAGERVPGRLHASGRSHRTAPALRPVARAAVSSGAAARAVTAGDRRRHRRRHPGAPRRYR